MNDITRRRFIKQVVAAGVGTALFHGKFPADGKEVASALKDSRILLTPPCLVRPTTSAITVNIVGGDKRLDYLIKFRESGERDIPWQKTETFSVEAYTPVSTALRPLKAGKMYEYQVHAGVKASQIYEVVAQSTFSTQKTGTSPHSFAMVADSHITPNEPKRLKILSDISASILARRPDYLLMLGDNIQTFTSHGGPMTEERYGPLLYYMLRQSLGGLPASVPVFNVIGNWEGENGWHQANQRGWARKARMEWLPGPLPDTYCEGGNGYGDYYGFTWGDTLNLVLTVTGYTLTEHVHGSKTGKADDWTLGDEQKKWLYKQLSTSKAKWKFIFIHHTVGGKAGDDLNTRYGRGGGQAAYVGEQALIHKWMQKFQVTALFYGHDHVFTDISVDGIHYICAGSAGAPWKFTKSETGYAKFWPDSGYTWVDVHEERLRVAFIKPDEMKSEGKILHQFEIK